MTTPPVLRPTDVRGWQSSPTRSEHRRRYVEARGLHPLILQDPRPPLPVEPTRWVASADLTVPAPDTAPNAGPASSHVAFTATASLTAYAAGFVRVGALTRSVHVHLT